MNPGLSAGTVTPLTPYRIWASATVSCTVGRGGRALAVRLLARGALPAMVKELVCLPNPDLRDRIVLLDGAQSALAPLLRLPVRKFSLVQLVARLLPLQHGFECIVARIDFLLQSLTCPVVQVVTQANLLLALGSACEAQDVRHVRGAHAHCMITHVCIQEALVMLLTVALKAFRGVVFHRLGIA